MNFKSLSKAIVVLLLIVSAFMFFPIAVAIYYGELQYVSSFLIPIFIVLFLAGFVFFIFRNNKEKILSPKEGFLMVSLSWILASFFGALPFYFSGTIPNFADAYFETMSGFTTTGASILTNIQAMPYSLLFWRSLTHWLGGMGIVVLTVAIMPLLGIGGLQLLKAEAPGPTVDKITPRIAQTAKILWIIYLAMTVLETILLMFGKMNFFDALTHTFGTLATGGFSTKNTSVGHYNSAYIDGVITVFMVLAGINFTMHFRVISGKFKDAIKDIELKIYLLIFFVASAFITFSLYKTTYKTIGTSIRYATFQVASILTTTGFATTDYEKWPYFAQMILFILMFIGGCSGSTGGGIKVIRIVTLFKQGLNEMKYLIHPKGMFPFKINGQIVKKNIVYSISAFLFLYIFMLLVTTFVVATYQFDILTSFTTALATVGNIGPGFGKVGPADNYAFYPNYIKWFLSFAMMVGRLELYTVLIILTPAFWKK